jgi:hypothetical protein
LVLLLACLNGVLDLAVVIIGECNIHFRVIVKPVLRVVLGACVVKTGEIGHLYVLRLAFWRLLKKK